METVDFDIAVIGGGPAGLTAGLFAARAGLKTVVFEKLVPGGQVATTNIVENIPGFPEGIGGPEYSMQLEAQTHSAGCEIIYEDVRTLDLAGKCKIIELPKRTVRASAVILAMGARRRKLQVPGEEQFIGRGVSYCATCDGAMYKGKPVAVIGGGNTAVEDALVLSRLASQVTLIHRRDALRAQSVLQERILDKNAGVELKWNSIVETIEGEQTVQRVHVVSTDGHEKQTLDVAAVFVAVGTIPVTDLVRGQVDLDEEGYIIADESCRTTLPNVYAAGDVRVKPLRQIVTAISDGAVAATMADRELTMSTDKVK